MAGVRTSTGSPGKTTKRTKMSRTSEAEVSISDDVDFASFGDHISRDDEQDVCDTNGEVLVRVENQSLHFGDAARAKQCLENNSLGHVGTLVVTGVAEHGHVLEQVDAQLARLSLETPKGKLGWTVRQKHRKPAAKWSGLKNQEVWQSGEVGGGGVREIVGPGDAARPASVSTGVASDSLRYSLGEARSAKRLKPWLWLATGCLSNAISGIEQRKHRAVPQGALHLCTR